ncbi:COP23 domain-containing protein [Chamaesiphon sp. VAR_69_metabat_338]|uniref:COP23 domain-containing protein n=1 Tax=Chamaesiphon sp. VAR_69_metabat_338 TaxID=2964704 RepID=UPI00286EA3A6|nr:COP23 domain-containing protein [Chamaesiphon sp. VAR_69_metabat_338]
MKIIILATLAIAELIMLGVQPSTANPLTVRFYCGQSFDTARNKILPTTFVATSARSESIALIRWGSSFGGYSPQVRCNMVASKFQTAWTGGNLKFIKSGVSDRTGQGIICGTADRQQKCDDSQILFTLKNHQDAKNIIANINNIRSGKTSGPSPQSAGDSPVDLEELIK